MPACPNSSCCHSASKHPLLVFLNLRTPTRCFDVSGPCRFGEWGPTLAEDFDTDKPVVCMCHAGVRSMQVANLMVDQGFTKVFNVSGGIEAWSCFIDPSVPRY